MNPIDGSEIASLEAWCERNIPAFHGIMTLEKFPGGQSNPTYLIVAKSGRYVLRRKPMGVLLPSAHAVDREFRLMSILGKLSFPVPHTYALCTDETVIGSDFYIMEAISGQGYGNGALPGVEPTLRRSVYIAMTETLADLHKIDPVANGLADYGKEGNYFERQVGRWTKQYRASQTDDVPEMEKLIDWLAKTIPPQGRRTIVHGDYRLDNLIFDDKGGVIAVLDWELSTLGDPLADLSYFTMSWFMPPDGRAAIGELDLKALGIPTFEEILEVYSQRSGLETIPDLNWYFAFNLFRYTAIVQGVKKRSLDGNASNSDTDALVAKIPRLARLACRFAEGCSDTIRLGV